MRFHIDSMNEEMERCVSQLPLVQPEGRTASEQVKFSYCSNIARF